MSIIIPAILPVSHEDLEEKLATLVGLVDSVQIDMVDGRFVVPSSWPYKDDIADPSKEHDGIENLPHLGELHFEMDLMVEDPEHIAGEWVTAGAERVVIHVESNNYIDRAIRTLESEYGHTKDFAPNLLAVGIGINIQTDVALIEPYLDTVDYVQFMGIANIGRQGEPFDRTVLRKIAAFKRKYPKMPIQVDGGVSLITAPALLSVGVDRLIVGSALWKAPNIREALQQFNDVVQEYGLYT
jgi:ribulose-phosphate 3-epimerase